MKKVQNTGARVKYPIGIKLVVIIAFLLILSLGAITFLVSYMVSQDLQLTAEDNNFEVNRRAAAEVEAALETIRSNVRLFLDTNNIRQTGALYFERNQDVAAIVVGEGGQTLINDRFFVSNELDPALVDEFMNRAAAPASSLGEMTLLNAAPVFGIPLLAMFSGTTTIIFSSEHLTDALGSSVNASFMINDYGDVLVHTDSDLVKAGANMAGDPLVGMLWKSPNRHFQTLYTDGSGVRYFGAFHKLPIANAAVITLTEYDLVFEGIAATTRRNILLTGAVLFISILLVWFFSKTISRPLGRLTRAAQKIESGQFEIELTKENQDEIGLLSESFVKMGKALESFSHFTNLEIARLAMRGDIALGGETRQATILFIDIRSFTAISEKLSPHEVVEFLNAYMTCMVKCVNETGGTVDKFMGDALMAHWGAVSSAGSPRLDALNCVRAALAMRKALEEFNAGRDGSEKQPRIRMGCGINSGAVVAGQIGSRERMEYTLIGDAVNLASRTEALNKPLHTDILITEATWLLAGKDLLTEEMPKVWVKGKEKSVRMFAVVNLRARKRGELQQGPVTLGKVRNMLGLDTPDLSTLDINEKELKYAMKKINEG
ncbi:adenylate/guanylate cyclase domain-containing protein [Spirochaetia bacterium]|nr:adenylate/guanylate cyclase domain-containing protein [Spirochaetia bacterium]